MKKSKKIILRQDKQDLIAQMEYEDSVGIRRKRFKPSFFTLKRIFVIKIVLLSLAAAAFFIYSPLLLPIFLIYGLLYYVSKRTERDVNYGIKKTQWVRIPKFDSLIALVLVVFCIGGTVLSAATTSTRGSMFEGKSEAQLRSIMEDRGMSSSKIDSMIERMEESGMFLTSFEKNLLKTLTCFTGHRQFFITKNEMALRVGISFGRRRPPDGGGGAPPQDAPVMSDGGGGMPDFSSIPLDMVINQIVSAVSFVLMICLLAGGIFVIVRLKKVKL